MTPADVLRLVVAVLAFFFIFQAVLIALPYITRIYLKRKTHMDTHVALVTVFSILMVIGGMTEVLAHFGHGFTWRVPVYGTAFTLGNVALFRFKMYLDARTEQLGVKVARMKAIGVRLQALTERR